MAAGNAGSVAPLLSIEWRQDRRLRTMAVSGALSSVDGSHLSSGLVQLGNRGLVIDLTGLDVWEADAVSSIVEVTGRLGARSARVVVSDPELGALLASRLASTVDVEVKQRVS